MALKKVEANGKPVLRINGKVLTDRDVLHEMYALFPYASQHNGFPVSMEGEIRRGATEMLIFEELVYQEAERRKMAVPARRIDAAETDLRKGLNGEQGFRAYLKTECNGSRDVLRQKIRRSMLIDALLKQEVTDKSTPTQAELRAYYNREIKTFTHGETFQIQTISIIPPADGGGDVKKEARQRADEAYKAAQKAKSYKEFGLLAEKYSDDDWHVNMGDRKGIERDKLPPPVLQAALKMKPGDVSPLIQLGESYTCFRLIAKTPAGKDSFESVKKKLMPELTKAKTDALRRQLNLRLRKSTKIEQL